MRVLFVGLAFVVALSMAGCAKTGAVQSSTQNNESASAAKPVAAPTAQDVVAFLTAHCSGAGGSIILEPSAWMPIGAGASSGSQRFQLDLSNTEDFDSSYVVAVDLTPSSSGGEFSMAPGFLQDTSFEMSVWGCDFATDPNAGANSGGDGGGGSAPAANMQSMPDLYGLSGDSVQQEVWSAGYQFHIVRDFTTFNPPSACLGGVSGVGMVVDQSVPAGSTFEDSSGYSVTVTIDCDYQF